MKMDNMWSAAEDLAMDEGVEVNELTVTIKIGDEVVDIEDVALVEDEDGNWVIELRDTDELLRADEE